VVSQVCKRGWDWLLEWNDDDICRPSGCCALGHEKLLSGTSRQLQNVWQMNSSMLLRFVVCCLHMFLNHCHDDDDDNDRGTDHLS